MTGHLHPDPCSTLYRFVITFIASDFSTALLFNSNHPHSNPSVPLELDSMPQFLLPMCVLDEARLSVIKAT